MVDKPLRAPFMEMYTSETLELANVSILCLCLVSRAVKLNLQLASPPQAPPKPLFTVPFRRDPDYVGRSKISAWIREKCVGPAARAALFGLGGVGFVN